MVTLATWLQDHKDQLVAKAVNELSLRREQRLLANGPVTWFFETLLKTIVENQRNEIESLMRNWVALCHVPINGEMIGLLPVLGGFKRAIWQAFQADPPASKALDIAIQLDGVLSEAAEFLAKVEAAALYDEFSHRLVAGNLNDTSNRDDHQNRFVSLAAHELRTPLTVIEGYTNMLKLELVAQANANADMMITGIQTGIGRLRSLIEDMIDVSLIESGLLRIDRQPVWLRRLLAIIGNEYASILSERKLVLKLNADEFPVEPIPADPERLFKALQKILENAIKYTPDGGTLTISGRKLPGFVRITIEDSGIGIAPENLDHIFDKFAVIGDLSRHSSGKTKFKGGGPGLGLVIARGIIVAHQGTIWAESTGYDEETCPGACFHIMLPLQIDEQSPLDGLQLSGQTNTASTPDAKPAFDVNRANGSPPQTIEETVGISVSASSAKSANGDKVQGHQSVADSTDNTQQEAKNTPVLKMPNAIEPASQPVSRVEKPPDSDGPADER